MTIKTGAMIGMCLATCLMVGRDKAHQPLLSCWIQRDGRWSVVFSQATDLPGPASRSELISPRTDRQDAKPEASKDKNEDGKPGAGKTIVINLRDVIVDEVDVDQNTITVTIGQKASLGDEPQGTSRPEGKVAAGKPTSSARLVRLPVAKDAEIRISSRRFPSVANNVPRALSELQPGMPASLELTVSEDEPARPIMVSKIVGWREP